MHRAAVRQRVRLVAPDRPGFGRSEFRPRGLIDFPAVAGFQQTAEAIDQLPVLFVDGAVPDRETLRPVKRHEANLPVRTVRAALDIKD
jgi:pimeloyl-ACP methyl ester carboxylesterase